MTRHDQLGNDTPGGTPITGGPRWYRRRIRTLGPLFGAIPMIVLGALALIALAVSDSRTSGLIGLVAGASAAPGLLLAGAPFGDDANYPLAVAASIPLWLALGWWASRRATTRSMAGWIDFVRELTWLTLAVIVGAIVGIAISASMVGESLIL